MVLHDDVLATGGTMAAAYALVKSMAFVAIELREIPANHMQGARVFESRGKVLEQDAFGGEVLHVADVSL